MFPIMNKNASFNNLRPDTIIRFQINIIQAIHGMMPNCYDHNLGIYDNNSFSNYRIELKIELILSFNMILVSTLLHSNQWTKSIII